MSGGDARMTGHDDAIRRALSGQMFERRVVFLTGVLAACDQRRATKNTRFRVSAPEERFDASFRDAAAQLERLRSRMDRFVARLADATGRSPETVADDVAAGRSLDAEGALRYGLLDEVIDRPDARVIPLPGRRPDG